MDLTLCAVGGSFLPIESRSEGEARGQEEVNDSEEELEDGNGSESNLSC